MESVPGAFLARSMNCGSVVMPLFGSTEMNIGWSAMKPIGRKSRGSLTGRSGPPSAAPGRSITPANRAYSRRARLRSPRARRCCHWRRVIDHHRLLSPHLAELGGNNAHGDIRAGAGAGIRDDRHGLVGIVRGLGIRQRRAGQCQQADCGKLQPISAFHDVVLPISLRASMAMARVHTKRNFLGSGLDLTPYACSRRGGRAGRSGCSVGVSSNSSASFSVMTPPSSSASTIVTARR